MINEIRSHLPATKVRRLSNFDVSEYAGLDRLGIGMDTFAISKIMGAMDAVQSTASTPTITSLAQFLQTFLPGLVYVLTAPRVIDEIIGISMVGSWEDSEIVQGVIERTGKPAVYDDYTNIPLASYNNAFERRSIIRFEQGFRVGVLEQAQSVKMNFSADKAKREACALALDIVRNTIAFNGFNSGNNRIYGFLNDPALPAYVNVPAGASGQTTWATKTFLEITRDLRLALAQLETQSNGLIDPDRTEIVLVIPTGQAAFLTTVSDLGYSVREWLDKNFPRVRIVTAPQLNAANGGLNVFYMFAARVEDSTSTDDGRVFDQLVQAKFQLLGVQQLAKGYEEDYSNATAGVLLKRPYAVVRYSGI